MNPLIINVSLGAGNMFLDCIVDTGAGVSLIMKGALPYLPNIEIKPSNDVTAISFGAE